MSKVALITGITGQDGSYLAEFLLDKGYKVHGLVRRSSTGINNANIAHMEKELTLHYSDLNDCGNLRNIIYAVKPDEIYNLAAQSHVSVSFQTPIYTGDSNGLGVLRLLEIVRQISSEKRIKFYQASTSELYGKVKTSPQNELTEFYPRSPYAVAKLYAYWITVNYRESYNLFACNGILFNHESPRRGPEFVTRKIVQGMIQQHLGLADCLELGNLDALRDWGHARDYVRAMWLMLQQEQPDDYVIATGEQHSVRDFCQAVAQHLGYSIHWQGKGLNEIGIRTDSGEAVVKVSTEFYRPAEVNSLIGNANKARQQLGWRPEYSFQNLVSEMCDFEIRARQP